MPDHRHLMPAGGRTSRGWISPATFAAVALLLGTVALAASTVPAWRAARTVPMDALRYE